MKTFTLLIAILFAACLTSSYAQNTWKKKADFGGLKRRGATGFSIGNKGYVGTGLTGSTTALSDLWEYDPSTNAWSQKADFGGGVRVFAVGFSIGNKGYVGTGGLGADYYNDFWEYDPATNAWTRKADFGGSSRRLAIGFSIGSKGYIGTGQSGISIFYNDFWEYDPASNVWAQKANIGGAGRWEAVGFSIGSKGYIGIGDDGIHDKKDFWEYDPGIDTWTQKANFGGGARDMAVGFSIDGKGYVGTGGFYYNDFWEYNPATNVWTQKANFGGTARYFAVGFSIGSKGYIGTGMDGSHRRDFWEYTPESTCLAPTDMKVQDLSDTTATLKWQVPAADVLKVRVRYRAEGGTAWIIKNRQGDKPTLHINGLTSNTTYQWQARSFCTADTTGWIAGPDFTTAASLNPGAKATAYPNPAMNAITVNYAATRNGKYIFEITNASGSIVLRKEAYAIAGANHITLDISRFFKGVYFISVIKSDTTRERIQLSKE